MKNSLTDIEGLQVGHAHDQAAQTGVTVIMTPAPMTAAVSVMGGGPGTRETDALAPSALVGAADAIVLAGGSVYGLGAGDRVTALLGAEGRGFGLAPDPLVPKSPIVPTAILYDLTLGDKQWGSEPPYPRIAEEAYRLISSAPAIGRVGAGFGAMAGRHRGGVGMASANLTLNGAETIIAALVAMNSVGSPYVPGTNQFWAAPFEIGEEFGGRGPGQRSGIAGAPPDDKLAAAPGQNTTIGVIATDAALTRSEAQRLAVMTQDGLARAIRPAHGPLDGDTIFALAARPDPMTEGAGIGPFALHTLGTAGADVMARAIARGVYAAEDA